MSALALPLVLFVDDDAANRHTLQLLFRAAGFAVQEAASGSEALRMAADKPDLIILDVNLPDINGFEVCRKIRMDPTTASVPVLHLSACFTDSADRVHGLESGADGYLIKPVEPRELIAQARALIRIHQAEEMARAAAQQWQATFDAIGDGVCLLDRQGRVLRCNQGAARLLGFDPDDLLGRHCRDLFSSRQGPCGGEVFLRMVETRRRESAEVNLGEHWFRVVADPRLNDGGDLVGAVYILSDITAHRRLEGQLRQVQKMEAVGRLAGGIAHDFNNLLAAITGNASLLLSNLSSSDPQHELLTLIDKAAWRAADLTRQLLGFSRQSPLQLRPLFLHYGLEEVAGLLRRTLDPRITLELRIAPDLWAVQADASQINQVLMNLCLNARDAMPDGGRLLLEVDNLTLNEDQALLHPPARPGEFVRLRVADTGCGIGPDVLPHVFEPFFTTKPIGKGTGLGLAVVSGIVEQHQGWIECSSEEQRGASFVLYLPRSSDQPSFALTGARLPVPGGSETILVVDDEPLLRDLGQRILQRHGYRILLARDGQEAVELFRHDREGIDLILLDWTMPRLSGQEALRQLQQLDPRVRVLLASGYAAGILAGTGLEGTLGLIEKPFREQDLALAVRSLLDRTVA